jgi:ATP-binding cassette, subfamily B, multidrug efflux pump
MFVLNPWLALATLIIVPVIYFFTNFIATYTRRGFRRLQKQLGGLNSVVEETISGQKVIKAFRRSEPVTELFREHNQAVYEAGVYANTYAMMLMPLSTCWATSS